MGTWDDRLYDNDSALDLVAAMTEVGVHADAATLVARIGLAAWLDPSAITGATDEVRDAVAAAEGTEALPPETRESLALLLADPEGATRDGSRSDPVRAVLGGYCDGPRFDPLLRFAGAQPVIEAMGERAAGVLDEALAPSSRGLYELAGELAALGLVVELAQAGLWRPAPGRVEAWRRGFAAADDRTRDEREFWDGYVRHVHAALELVGGCEPALSGPRVSGADEAS